MIYELLSHATAAISLSRYSNVNSLFHIQSNSNPQHHTAPLAPSLIIDSPHLFTPPPHLYVCIEINN